jgi:RHS repeat-associated protein
MTNATGGTSTSMGYTGIDNSQRTSAGSTTFTNNTFGVASSTTSGTTDYFTRDPSGRLNSFTIGSTRYYYLYDGIGNIIGLINTSGTQVATYTYDPYGNTTATGTEASANPYQYEAGYDDPTGYIKFGARYYNPTLAAWTQLDPSGANSGYTYVGGNPINDVDLAGTSFLDLSISGCLVVCLSAGVDINSNGSVHPHVGVGIGPDASADVSADENTGNAKAGPELDGSCSAGPVQGDASVDSSGTISGGGGGVTSGADVGCEGGVSVVG